MSLQSCGGEAVAIAFVADKTGFPLFLVSPHVQRQLAGRGKRGVADITGGDIYTGSVQLDVFVIQRVTIVASGYGRGMGGMGIATQLGLNSIYACCGTWCV